MPSRRITGISHVDLSVTDLDASVAWYQELFGMAKLFSGRNDELGYDVCYLRESGSGVIMGFEQHDANPGSPFDERRVGLDHLSFDVESREQLDSWLARLDELDISHSGIADEPSWDVLVFRDPDNVQLEFVYIKPEGAERLTASE